MCICICVSVLLCPPLARLAKEKLETLMYLLLSFHIAFLKKYETIRRIFATFLREIRISSNRQPPL